MGKSNPMDKSFDISKRLVWEAYKSVKANQGAAGVDGQSVEAFEADLHAHVHLENNVVFPRVVGLAAVTR